MIIRFAARPLLREWAVMHRITADLLSARLGARVIHARVELI